eukprot:TRINITY_DN10500_c0_g1_i5.p2 TRINITY_DN10500_c0_g1~~TRINITY_DN10500_c0_g1_i5.p2  ORF type:complete len:144 (-),score=10.62 TRINITY_DN10500_c0_g1_i5:53-484(-)
MIAKCANPSILLRPEPRRIRTLFLANADRWYERSAVLATTLNSFASGHCSGHCRCESFRQELKALGYSQPKMKELISIPKRTELKELLLISQELEWRHCWCKLFPNEDPTNVPERPPNPMTKDSLFMKREKEEVYNSLECVEG